MLMIEDLIEKINKECFTDTKRKAQLTTDLINIKKDSDFDAILVLLEENPDLLDMIFESSLYLPQFVKPTPRHVFSKLKSTCQRIFFI